MIPINHILTVHIDIISQGSSDSYAIETLNEINNFVHHLTYVGVATV